MLNVLLLAENFNMAAITTVRRVTTLVTVWVWSGQFCCAASTSPRPLTHSATFNSYARRDGMNWKILIHFFCQHQFHHAGSLRRMTTHQEAQVTSFISLTPDFCVTVHLALICFLGFPSFRMSFLHPLVTTYLISVDGFPPSWRHGPSVYLASTITEAAAKG